MSRQGKWFRATTCGFRVRESILDSFLELLKLPVPDKSIKVFSVEPEVTAYFHVGLRENLFTSSIPFVCASNTPGGVVDVYIFQTGIVIGDYT